MIAEQHPRITAAAPGPAADLIEYAAGIIAAKRREPHTAPYHWAGALWEAGLLHWNLADEVDRVTAACGRGVAEGRRQAADAIREHAEAAKTVDLTGPRAVRYRALLAAARIADNPPTLADAAEALHIAASRTEPTRED